MSLHTPSRNPFAAPNHLTLADLIVRIGQADDPPLAQRRNWCWALRALCRAAACEPSAVPAHPEFVRWLCAKAAPAAIGLPTAAWNNARSLAGKALAWAGLATMPGRYQSPHSAAWAALWAALPPDTALSYQLSRLFHYGSANGIEPGQISDSVLSQFHTALVTESLVELPYEIYRGAARSWNNAVERIAGWPQIRLQVPSKRQTFSLPWTSFPPSLHQEVEAYLRRMAGIDLSEDVDRRPQRPQTLETRRKNLRYFATAVVRSGTPIETLVSLERLLDPAMVKLGLTLLTDKAGGKSSVNISLIADFLPTLARRIGLPAATVDSLRRFAKRLTIEHNGFADRHRDTLRQLDDPEAVTALVTLPQRMLAEVRRSGATGARAAKRVQSALAIELLLNAPVRIGNLAGIETDRHLLEVRRAPRMVHLRFPAHEVKNRTDLEFPLTPDAIDLLDIYLTDYRPALGTPASRFLFPGKSADRAKWPHHLSVQINAAVFDHTRLKMPAHRFRHAVAKIFLDRNPGQYEVMRQLLGHRSIDTTTRFYAGAETAAAVRHYAATILGIRVGQPTTSSPRAGAAHV